MVRRKRRTKGDPTETKETSRRKKEELKTILEGQKKILEDLEK